MKRGVVRDVIAGDRLVGQRIEDRGDPGKIPRPLRQSRNAEEVRQRLAYSLAVVIDEVKRAFCNWTAQRAAKLILAEGRRRLARLVEEILCVENVIPYELV